MKQPSIAVVALMLALVMLAPGGARAACLPAIIFGVKPSRQCCTHLTEQQGCLCQYAKDPSYGSYIKSPNASKTLRSCGVPVPQC